MNIDYRGLDFVWRTIYGEARGESDEGKRAVAHVIFNRAEKRGKTLSEIVLEPYQFSVWNNDDPNRVKITSLPLEKGISCFIALLECMLERQNGFKLDNCLHYHSVHVNPYWTEGKVPTRIIGNHLFYNNID